LPGLCGEDEAGVCEIEASALVEYKATAPSRLVEAVRACTKHLEQTIRDAYMANGRSGLQKDEGCRSRKLDG
jgi:hypothetical protein